MSEYDLYLDRDLDDYYSDAEDDVVEDDDWMIDKFIEERQEYDKESETP